MTNRSWHVAYTHPHAEEVAKNHLSRQGFGVYLPCYLATRRHARRVQIVSRPLFPRYLFFTPRSESVSLGAVNNTVGVCHALSTGPGFARVSEYLIDGIRAREDEDGFIHLDDGDQFRSGDRVVILDGPFADLVGLFHCRDDRDRIVVLLDLLGRQLPVYVGRGSIAASA